MTHNPDWHREYARLENAEMDARLAYRSARGAKKAIALETFRAAGKARFDFEMAGAVIVDISTMPTKLFWQAMLAR